MENSEVCRNARFNKFTMFYEDFLDCHIEKTNINLDGPIYKEFIVLNLAKQLMYDLYYSMLKEYDPNITLYSMDTDSFFLQTSIEPTVIIKNNMDELIKQI